MGMRLSAASGVSSRLTRSSSMSAYQIRAKVQMISATFGNDQSSPLNRSDRHRR